MASERRVGEVARVDGFTLQLGWFEPQVQHGVVGATMPNESSHARQSIPSRMENTKNKC